jgi:hypothetical protein
MVRHIDQQDWTEIEEDTMIGVDEAKDFSTVHDKGKFDVTPMLIHLREFKAYPFTTCKEDETFILR